MKSNRLTILSIALCTFATQFSTAQSSSKSKSTGSATFQKGTSVLQANLGLGGGLGLPIQLSYELGVTDKIGVGALVGFASQSIATYRYNYIIIGARGNYHHQFIDKLDTYGGLTLGYQAITITPTLPGGTAGKLFLAGQLGGRYYFTDKLAASAELGYGIGYLNIGVAYKLK